MKRLIHFKSVKQNLLFWFLIMATIPILIICTIVYFQWIENMKDQEFSKLSAIRDLKVHEINKWIEERENDIKAISEDIEIKKLESLSLADSYIDDIRVKEITRNLFYPYLENCDDYSEIFFINAKTGLIKASTRNDRIGVNRINEDYYIKAIETKNVFIKDIYQSETTKEPSMIFSAPVYSVNDNNKIIGVIAARIDLSKSLYELLLNKTGLGKTGETILINKDKLILNELRWFENAPLHLQSKSEPTLRAADGETGTIETLDYRGVKVIASFTNISKMEWGLVAKQDFEELYKPIFYILIQFIFIIIIFILIIYLTVTFLSKVLSSPINIINSALKDMQKGNYSIQIPDIVTERKDELGFMGISYNEMSHAIKSKINIQDRINDIIKSSLNAAHVNEYCRILINEIMPAINSNFGVSFLFNEKENSFNPVFSLGLSENSINKFNKNSFEGDIGVAVNNKEIVLTKNNNKNSDFLFKVASGSIIPREILTIPVLINSKVYAVLTFGTVNYFTKEDIDLVNQLWVNINIGFSKMIASEEINKIAKELEIKNKELSFQSEELERQSNELKQQNIELKYQKEMVEHANKLKNEFLSNMSHELRTPLNSVMALSKLLISKSSTKLSEEEVQYLDIIQRNGKKLLQLINDILDLAKIEAGKSDVIISKFSVKKIIDEIMDSLLFVAEEKKIKIINDVSDNIQEISSDERKVYQIVQNIMSNAIKFTEKGKVSIKVNDDSKNIYITIKDTGIGISKEHLSIIFEEFRQIDGSSSKKYAGTGLGLAIVYKTVKLLGGDISVQSTLGKGSSFIVKLPKNLKMEDYMQSAIMRNEEISDIQFDMIKQYKILLVEDNEVSITQIKHLLENEQFIVDVANDGEEALKYIYQGNIPDGIILDLMMPGMDGFETLDKLRDFKETKKLPVLIITSKDLTKDDLSRLSYNNVQQLVQKGNIDTKELLFRIRTMLNNDQAKEKESKHLNKVVGRIPKILIIEDNFDNMLTIEAVLKDNYQIIESYDGKDGLNKIMNEKPDLVLMDISLPELDGYEIIKIIRKDVKVKNIPVIAITAHAMKGDKEKILYAGFDDYLDKPVDLDVLLDTLKKFI